jgi:nicotinamide mononucleotide transporter
MPALVQIAEAYEALSAWLLMSPLEMAAFIVNTLGLWLMARRNLLCWPVCLVGVALLGWVFLDAKLYSDMLLQGFFAVANIYGWMNWKAGAVPDGTVAVAKPTLREMGIGFVAGAIGAAVLGYAMAHYTDAAAPWLDSVIASYSIVAQFWTARRFIESWWLWIALDVISIGLYLFKGLNVTAALYLILMVLCFYGIVDWRKAERAQA